MRLLNAETYELVSFAARPPKYAILSHTWGSDSEEVSFTDVESGRGRAKRGWAKLTNFCSMAKRFGFDYCWMDTCSIDKRSSAELSEAINSMFKWYQKAAVCFVFLQDISCSNRDIPSARWFTRGWTLQELVASENVIFFDGEWDYIGCIGRSSPFCDMPNPISNSISRITGIDADIFTGKAWLKEKSIARRMSWAADRRTTKVEDASYCLLGIFDVNMPLLYGEGERAFQRLQEEIIKKTNDHSILAFGRYPGMEYTHRFSLLADSPVDFKNVASVVPFGPRRTTQPYTISGKGLQIRAPLMSDPDLGGNELALLDCFYEEDYTTRFALAIRKHTSGTKYSLWGVRLVPYQASSEAEIRDLYLDPPNSLVALFDFPFNERMMLRCYANCQQDTAGDLAIREVLSWRQMETVLTGKHVARMVWVPERYFPDFTETVGIRFSRHRYLGLSEEAFVVVLSVAVSRGVPNARVYQMELQKYDPQQGTFVEWFKGRYPDRYQSDWLQSLPAREDFSESIVISGSTIHVKGREQELCGHEVFVLDIAAEPSPSHTDNFS